jgi:hypothetical protein
MGITQQIGASSLIKPGVIDTSANRPASPYEGQVIFQKDTDQLLVWNGTAWVIPNQTTQNPEGLELIKTQTIGSAVSSVEVTNAFSSTYDNYLITVNGGVGSGTTVMRIVLGATVTNYHYVYSYSDYISTAAAEGGKTATLWNYVGNVSGDGLNAFIKLFSPNLAKETKIVAESVGNGTQYIGSQRGSLFNTTQYTSFTLSVPTGTMTGGTIRVYGYRNS